LVVFKKGTVMAVHSLVNIQNKVRRLTRSPSEAQITTAQLNEYINTFVVYDFPEHLRTFNLRTAFSFYCNPFQDTYQTDTSVLLVTNALYDFQNKYLTVHPPLYIAGYQALFTQSQEQFYAIYPKIESLNLVTQGDGVTTTFSGVINNLNSPLAPLSTAITAILPNNVLFSSVDIGNAGLALYDVPHYPSDGQGTLFDANTQTPQGIINYLTGQFSLTFINPPAVGVPINSQVVFYQPSLPQAMLFYANTFTLRPVPDQPYKINFEVYKAPVDLLASNSVPELNEWWQYIAYGAAKKILEDRLDMDTVALITPEFLKQQNLCNRRTLVQYTNERPATIYTQQTDGTNGYNGFGGGMGQF
jgi:hypothetical protein